MEYNSEFVKSNPAKSYVNKHVTIACQTCRKRRCKCDGQTPCTACSRAAVECIYNYNDGRRHRHTQNLFSHVARNDTEKTTDATQADDEDGSELRELETHKNRKSKHAGSKTNPCKTRTQRHAGSERRLLSRSVADLSSNCHSNKTTLPRRDRLSADMLPQPESRTMKDMQGIFVTRTARPKCKTYAGPSRIPRHKLLPNIVSTARQLNDVVDSSHEKHKSSSEQQMCQAVWPVGRKGYAVPGYTRTFGNLPFSSSIKANGYPASVQHLQSLNVAAPDHLIMPLVSVDESPLGRAMIDFQYLGRRLMAEGTPPLQLADQGPIDVTLFFRQRLPGDPVNASTWAVEMLRAFRGTFPDQLLLACAVCVGSLMRWLLVPTRENYARMPALTRPTQLQRFKPHPPWVDLMVFPTFRDALVNSLRDWIEPCIEAKWNFSWPHSLEAALVRNADNDHISLTSEFTIHVGDIQNWSMQTNILQQFPELGSGEVKLL